MAYPAFNLEDHIMKHFFLYCRLAILMACWFCLQLQPVIYLAMVSAQIVIGDLDKLILSLDSRPQQVTLMLTTIMDKITTYLLLFGTVAHI